MRKNLLVLLALLCCLTGFSQGVVVNTTSYGNANATQLVNNVLVENSCLVQTANISKTTGLSSVNYAQGNSIGYFTNSNTAFPMSAGVVMVSGDALTATGPNTSSSSDGPASASWVGDADLEAAFAAAGIQIKSMNATVLEFEFTAVTNTISIPYIFASEEYGQYQCTSKDGMVILLKAASAPASAYQNIALIPNTSTPVSVSTLRDASNSQTVCSSENAQYFGAFYGGGSKNTAPINFEGRSVLLTATATVTPGTTYRIKIVVADDGEADKGVDGTTNGTDGRYNSAVFLPSAGVNLGQQVLGNDLVSSVNTALCQGETHTITTNLTAGQFGISWTKDSDATVLGTGTSLNVTQSGTYVLHLTNTATNCTTTQDVVVEFATLPAAGTPNNLYSCPGNNGQYSFNLNSNTTAIIGQTTSTTVTYHATQANAEAGQSPLSATFSSAATTPTTIYARLKSTNSSCYTVVTFDLVPVIPPVANTVPTLQGCETALGAGTSVFNLTSQNAGILGTQNPSLYNVLYYTSQANANAGTDPITTPLSYTSATTTASPNQTIYARVQSTQNTTCYAVTSFTIHVNALPPVSTLSNTQVCGSYTLPVITNGTYWTQSGGTGAQYAAGDVITTPQTIYIYNTNAAGCSNQSSFTIDVLSTVPDPADVTVCTNYTLPALPAGQEYHTAANGGGTTLASDGTAVITATQDVWVFIPTAATCTADISFKVTIITADDPADVTMCTGTYSLPALTNGTYWSAPGGPSGGGTQYNAGANINSTRTIYVYNAAPGASCFVENSFEVYIAPTIPPRNNVSNCGNFALPPITIGKYYSSPGGVNPIVGNITATQTVYIYYSDAASGCTSEVSFTVTINPVPPIFAYQNVIGCGSYALPQSTSDAPIVGFYTGSNKTGTFYAPGSVVTETTTLFAVTTPNVHGCDRQRQFTVTVIGAEATTPGNQNVCGSYTLPSLGSTSKYYTLAGGPATPGNTQIPNGTKITANQTIHVYQTYTSGSVTCNSEGSFTVTVSPEITIPDYPNVATCDPYILPPLPAGQQYYAGSGATGGTIAAGTPITATQLVYVYAQGASANCFAEDIISVRIVDVNALTRANVTACESYKLPGISGAAYYPQPNGQGGQIAVGTEITSNQTIYIFTNVTVGTNCTANLSFTVTINGVPSVSEPADVVACNEYILPALTEGNYFSGQGGTGTAYNAGDVISNSMTMYVYSSNGNCEAESTFEISVTPLVLDDIADQLVCSNEGFTLPAVQAIPNATVRYYTQSGGPATAGNTEIAAGTAITQTQDVYIYAFLTNSTTCSTEQVFHVDTVAPPVIDNLGVLASCTSLTLPALSNGNYYTQPGGGGTMYSGAGGQIIYQSTTLYIFAQSGGTPNCTSENEVTVLVNPEPPANVTTCDSYILPALPAGQQYYSAAGGNTGTGAEIPAGTAITSTQDVYFFIPSAAACTQDTKFTVTINHTPVLDTFTNVSTCDEYVLPALTTGNYFSGDLGTGTQYFAGDIITSSMTMYVYAETATFPNCFAGDSFDITITPTPTVIARSDVEICDSYELLALPAGYHYYRLSGGATATGQQEIAAGTVFTTNATPSGTTVYIYAEAAANPACFVETSYNIMIYSAAVDGEIVQLVNTANNSGSAWAETYSETINGNAQLSANIEACDTYTLPDLNVGGSNPTDTYIQQYYTLPGGLDTPGQQAVSNLTITASTTVYLYRTLLGRVDCSDESKINITINNTPAIAPADLPVLVPGDISDCFTHTLPVLPAPFAYYSNPNGVNPIADTTITASQHIYIYGEVGTNRICETQYDYQLTINTIDVPKPADVVACEEYILPAATPLTARYFQLPGGPNTSGQVEYAVGHIFTPGDYSVYVWDETKTTPNCTDEEVFAIKVVNRPVGTIPTGLVTCSIDDNGENGIFNLTAAIAEAIGAQADVAATVHETMPSAELGVNIVPDVTAYVNVNDFAQTLYIRLYSTLSPDCYSIVPLQLTVNPRPIAVDPIGPYELCDNGASDTDGLGVFNLNNYVPTVLGTLDPNLHTVAFYQSMADLNAGGPIIATPATFTTPSTTVYIKVTITSTGCYDVVPLQLVVNPMPVVTKPTPLSLCDENNFGDEIEEFDLTTKIDEITGGVFGMDVTFHLNLTDAEGNVNAIPNPEAYENIVPGVQPIYVRVTDAETGCYRIVLLDIRVEPLPVLTQPTTDELTVCGTNEDGFGNFDLDQIAQEMIDGGVNMTVQFYWTMTSALNNLNPIAGTANFQNTNAFNQALYVVATNTITGCRSEVYVINLVVDPAPADVNLADLRDCDDEDSNGQNNQMIFDLTQQNAAIEAQLGVAPGTYTIHYFTSLANAQAGAPRITSPATYSGQDAQTIWVRIEVPATECFIIKDFQLFIDQPQELAHPSNYILCDDELPNNGVATFDLTSKNDEILTTSGVGEGNVVQYFVTEADRDAAINPISPDTAYQNVQNPQTIYILVTTPAGCISKESMTLVVNPRPTPDTTPDTLVTCDNVTIGDGIEPFNLNDAAIDILDGDTQSVLEFYATAADLAAGVQIPNPAAHQNVTPWNDSVLVRVTRTDSQPGSPVCDEVVTLNLRVDSLPPVFNAAGVVPLYAICTDNTTGFEQFNLIGHINNLLTEAGEVPTNYNIRFYANQADIATGPALPSVYTNITAGHQQIWVVVTNNATTCRIETTLDLYAEQAAVANPIVTPGNNPIQECDYDGANDGFTQFDLTPAGAEALGSQSPSQFSVEYYLTEAAANAGDTTSADFIATPAAFTNTVYLTQTIWVRITNTATNSPCYALASFDVQVDLLPEPVITSSNGNTICEDFVTGQIYRSVELWSGVANAGHTYQWYLNGTAIAGATNEFYTADEAGDYTVEVASAEGCLSDPIQAFTVIQSGPASLINDGYVVSNAFSDNQTLTVLVEGYGEYQYALDVDGPWQNSNVFENMPIGYYTVYIRDVKTDNPCDVVQITDVSNIDYPRFFTPNGDGFNDYWNIVGLANFEDAKIFIFDRYGKLIKQLSPASNIYENEGWDGTYNGRPMVADDYWFKVEFTENGNTREFKAHFSLKR